MIKILEYFVGVGYPTIVFCPLVQLKINMGESKESIKPVVIAQTNVHDSNKCLSIYDDDMY